MESPLVEHLKQENFLKKLYDSQPIFSLFLSWYFFLSLLLYRSKEKERSTSNIKMFKNFCFKKKYCHACICYIFRWQFLLFRFIFFLCSNANAKKENTHKRKKRGFFYLFSLIFFKTKVLKLFKVRASLKSIQIILIF